MFTGGTDLNAVTDPSNVVNFPRVKLNTALDMLGFRPVQVSGSITFNSNTWTVPRVIYSHNLGYAPILWGWVTVGTNKVPIRGGVIISESNGTVCQYSFASTVNDVVLQRHVLVSVIGQHSVTINYNLILANYGITSTGTAWKPPFSNSVDIQSGASGYVKSGYFDTSAYNYAYINSAADMVLTTGRTIDVSVGQTPNKYLGVGLRQSVAGYVAGRATTFVNATYPGTNTAFAASYSRVSV